MHNTAKQQQNPNKNKQQNNKRTTRSNKQQTSTSTAHTTALVRTPCGSSCRATDLGICEGILHRCLACEAQETAKHQIGTQFGTGQKLQVNVLLANQCTKLWPDRQCGRQKRRVENWSWRQPATRNHYSKATRAVKSYGDDKSSSQPFSDV